MRFGEPPFSIWKMLGNGLLRQNSMSAGPAIWVTEPTSWKGLGLCTPRKLLDVNRLQGLGWRPTIRLEEGLRQTYAWFLENQASLRT
jgi:nucleoside-diphosphate-sugar epimerase